MVYGLAMAGVLVAYLALQGYLRERQLKEMLDLQAAERASRDAAFERLAGESFARLSSLHEAHRSQLAELHEAHRQEIAGLHQARMEEVANLLQRIQAPEQATATHAAETALPDPPPVNLESDDEMFELYQKRVEELGVG